MIVNNWARKWGVPEQALEDLRATICDHAVGKVGMSEAAVQQRVRIAESRNGVRLWRNNVGVLRDSRGVPVRFGLCNDSPALNKRLKSADLIGITPVSIGGQVVGVFTSIEVKRPGWKYTGTGREKAQLAWAQLVVALGGIAKFSTGE